MVREIDAREGYAIWADSYSPFPHNALMRLEHRAMLELIHDVDAARCLDLACGTGRYTIELRKRGARSVVGIDLSPEMLAGAKKISANLVCADLSAIPLRSSIMDVIVCGLAIGHVVNLTGAMGEAARVLAPGGRIVYSDFHPVGAQLGWKRSFTSRDGKEYVLRHHVHSRDDHESACRAAGLRIEAVREPRIDFRHQWQGYPAALVICAHK